MSLSEQISLGILIITGLAVIFSVYYSNQSNRHVEKQLTIEQEPHVVIKDGIYTADPLTARPGQRPYAIKIKNIGRGPALRVNVSSSKTDPNKPLFEATEPHSVDLGSDDEKNDWKIDQNNLNVYVGECYPGLNLDTILTNNPIYLYIYCYDQLGNRHVTETKLESCNPDPYLKVMENI